ncbi:hypothetical protein CHU98_g5060 [Xylaria longipes]|nr:hypothetical protein CHU98_g5060 [Xylaria longipes]
MAALEAQKLSSTEETEVQQWITTSERLKSSPQDASILDKLNAHLTSRATLLGTKPSKADVAIYQSLAPAVKAWTPEQRTGQQGHPHIVRHLDFVQNSGLFGLNIGDEDKIKVDPEEVLYVKPPTDAKAEKERLKKEKAAAAAATGGGAETTVADLTKAVAQVVVDKAVSAKDAVAAAAGVGGEAKPKKEKKEKAPKPQKAPAVTTPPSPHLIDLRVGHILKAIKHPEADSLYVSTIAMGDKPGTDDTEEYEGQVCRTVCSGLNGLVPLEEMQGRKVVVVANLKPVKMRGIKSGDLGDVSELERESARNDGLGDKEWAVLKYADEMTRLVSVDDVTFGELRNLCDEREVVEVTATVAAYNCVSRFLVALDVGERNGTEPDDVKH